jgi:hypothetical protein
MNDDLVRMCKEVLLDYIRFEAFMPSECNEVISGGKP